MAEKRVTQKELQRKLNATKKHVPCDSPFFYHVYSIWYPWGMHDEYRKCMRCGHEDKRYKEIITTI